MKYNPITKEVKVLLDGLPSPGGPVISSDRSFVLFSEFMTQRVRKFWLTGPKRNTTEVLVNLPGNPLKIKRATGLGEFWVAVNQVVQQQPRLVVPFGFKFNSNGQVLLIKDFRAQYNNVTISVVQEYFGTTLYVGSRDVNYVTIYRKF